MLRNMSAGNDVPRERVGPRSTTAVSATGGRLAIIDSRHFSLSIVTALYQNVGDDVGAVHRLVGPRRAQREQRIEVRTELAGPHMLAWNESSTPEPQERVRQYVVFAKRSSVGEQHGHAIGQAVGD